jgi:hypothetical protein
VDINVLPDPCPLPHTVKKRGLNDKERLLYAPMADVGCLLYDKDAMYIDIPDWRVGLLGFIHSIGCLKEMHANCVCMLRQCRDAAELCTCPTAVFVRSPAICEICVQGKEYITICLHLWDALEVEIAFADTVDIL